MGVCWAFLSRVSAYCVAAALSVSTVRCDSSQAVSDESLRLVALRAVFVGMQVSADRGTKIDDSWPKERRDGQLFFPTL